MGHFARLQLVGRVTYYVGWIALLWGGGAPQHCNEAVPCAEPLEAESVRDRCRVLSDLHSLGTPGSRLGWSPGVQHREESSGCLKAASLSEG